MQVSLNKINVKKHEYFMLRAFELAKKGLGNAAPNPLVGAVIVCDNKIIGEGYHQKYGAAHAEVNAVRNAADYHHLLSQSTLYVSLEPCCFHGKTPACTNLILKHKIPRVVISALDVTPEVNGKGVKILRKAGIELITGILKQEGEALVSARSVFVRKKRPYVILKFAQSQDAYFGKEQEQVWISNAYSKRLVHKWRGETDAILVGTNTAKVDNPSLTNRLFYGKSPIRIVLDQNNQLSQSLNLFNDDALTYVVSDTSSIVTKNTNHKIFSHKFDETLLPDLLHFLHQQNIGNLIVEGGKQLLESFIALGLWDEARVFVGNKILTSGIAAPKLPIPPSEKHQLMDDQLYVYRKSSD